MKPSQRNHKLSVKAAIEAGEIKGYSKEDLILTGWQTIKARIRGGQNRWKSKK